MKREADAYLVVEVEGAGTSYCVDTRDEDLVIGAIRSPGEDLVTVRLWRGSYARIRPSRIVSWHRERTTQPCRRDLDDVAGEPAWL